MKRCISMEHLLPIKESGSFGSIYLPVLLLSSFLFSGCFLLSVNNNYTAFKRYAQLLWRLSFLLLYSILYSLFLLNDLFYIQDI